MAQNLPGTGPLTPAEIAYLAENEDIVVVPRQRLDGLDLISGYIPTFRPPQRTTIPLWLALVLKKQRRCNIIPPPWLTSSNIDHILLWEHENTTSFSPALPWRWFETAEILLNAAADDIPDASIGGEKDLRVLLRGLREIRQTKAREGLKQLEGTYLQMNGLGVMEITELRGFASRVVDDLRRLGAGERGGGEGGGDGGEDEEGDSDEDMLGGSSVVESAITRTTTTGGAGRSSEAVRGSSLQQQSQSSRGWGQQ